MKTFVYAIYSGSSDQIYVGMSTDAQRRLREHNTGKSRYTKPYRPWICFYTEEYLNYGEARAREKKLKSTIGKSYLKEKLKDYQNRL